VTRNCVRKQHGSLPEGKAFGKEGKLPCKRKLVIRMVKAFEAELKELVRGLLEALMQEDRAMY
jgi:hypothetical protein